MNLGKLGVWSGFDTLTAAESAAFAKRIEQWGYSTLWTPETIGRDVIQHSGWLLANTSSLNIATGIANIYGRDPLTMHAGQMGLNEMSGGRFLLGIGVSHGHLVTGVRGHDYGKPVETMRKYLAAMKSAMYRAPIPAESPKTVLAALGPKMLELARDEAAGAHPYNVTPAHTAQARKILGPGKLLLVEQMAILETDPARARNAARKTLKIYLTLPNYANNWIRMGFSQDDIANGGSDRLIDDTVAWGNEADIIKRIEQHWEAGADHVCIQTLDADRAAGEKLLASLARLNR
ncbi:MAG: TIGR03620 family F420-dependent LLM class oxidoreductase [Georgfuchsia sp.]